jgi:nucleotide-binding universal stress UspA family protein
MKRRLGRLSRLVGVGGLVVLALPLAACFKAPEIVMVDRATALEQQAAGSFEDLEQKLDRAGIEPRPVPFTPEQLEALGIRQAPLVDGTQLTDADRLDGLLLQHCVGEDKDGLLESTRDACHGGADAQEVETLVERVNRARRQLWKWMHEQRASVSESELQRAWRETHARNVVCGGWTQAPDGTWKEKPC